MNSSTPIRAYFGDSALSAGFMAVPHLLRRHYRELGLEEETFVFVLQLLAMIWDIGRPPHNLRDIAELMGKNINTVRRYSATLNQLGLVVIRERFRGGQQIGNDYDLSPLWERLSSFAAASRESEDEVGQVVRPVRRTNETNLFGRQTQISSPPIQKRTSHPDENGRPTHTEMRAPGHTKMHALKKKEEESISDAEAAAAAATFSAIVSREQAWKLVRQYPECIPDARALVAEARHGKKPAGLLIHLIERGWTPPQSAGVEDEAEVQPCPVCGGDLAICHGMHGLVRQDIDG